MKIGEEWTSRKFQKAYSLARAAPVLEHYGYIRLGDSVDRKPKAYRYYRVLANLPTKEEFLDLYYKYFTSTLRSLMESAYEEIEIVRDELEEWKDGLPEGLDQSSTAEALEEAVDLLQEIEDPGIPDSVGDLQVVFVPTYGSKSRNKRLSEAQRMLEDVRNRAGEFGGTNPGDELLDLFSELDDHLDRLENVECPGMFGG